MPRGSHDGAEGIIGGINVTPLVDITLVLLIIFMVTAHVTASLAMPVNLPRAAPTTKAPIERTVLSLELTRDGKLHVDGMLVERDEDVARLARTARARTSNLDAVIRSDASVEHGRVVRVLDLLKTAGVSNVAFARPRRSVPHSTESK